MSRIEKIDAHIQKLEELSVYTACDDRTLKTEYKRCLNDLKKFRHNDAGEELYYCELERGFLECIISQTTPMMYYNELRRLKDERRMLARSYG